MSIEILDVDNLTTYFDTPRGIVRAVNGIDMELRKGECLCLVGESGCGKSVTVLSLLGLIDSPPGKIIDGQVLYKNADLTKCSRKELQRIRGKEIAIVFQDAQSFMNPVFTIGDQIVEQLKRHLDIEKNEARERALTLLKDIGIPMPERALVSFPHQLSGGMKQRAMIAMGLSCDPQVLIADEPTTAVDVTIKAQILDIFRDLKRNRNMSLIFVTHDLGVVAEIGDRAQVIYGGKGVETASVEEIIEDPKHPYTMGLIACLPDIAEERDRLVSIPGTAPDPIDLPPGCPFHPRCQRVMPVCSQEEPRNMQISAGHTVRCHLYQ